jgi:hypothetical protein
MCICGRKKLPFAGYSVVKERQIFRLTHGRRRSRLRAPFRVPELLILRPQAANSNRAAFQPSSEDEQTETSGEYRARTGDLLVANQALSQLS